MLSRKEIETFAEMDGWIRQMESHIDRMKRKMKSVQRKSLQKNRSMNKPSFTQEEVGRLVNLNRRISEVQNFMDKFVREMRPIVRAQIAAAGSCLYDFGIGARLDFIRRADDPEFDPDEHNILTTRSFWLSRDHQWFDVPSMIPGLAEEEECYLFHDLHNTHFNLQQRELSLRELTRIGSIWVGFEVRHQAMLDCESGEWRVPDSSLE